MNTAKTTKREPNKKELRKDLADKKAKYEELGWARNGVCTECAE